MKTQITEVNKYSTKDIAKWIRQTLKEELPEFKFSVSKESYSGGSSITIVMLQSPIRMVRRFEEISESEILSIRNARNDTKEEVVEFIKQRINAPNHEINQYHLETDWELTEKGKEIAKKVLEIANKHNWDNSDPMTDYFDVNYYLTFKLGRYDKPFNDGVE